VITVHQGRRQLRGLGVHQQRVARGQAPEGVAPRLFNLPARGMAEHDSIGFDLMEDVTGEIAGRYGLYDRVLRRTTPGYFVIDRGGIVRLAVLGQGLPARGVAGFARYAIIGI